MITGRGSGSGTYSYQETHRGNSSALVAHMPEDSFRVRIVFRSNGEPHIPIMIVSEIEAELLWCSLNRMAKDLKWDDSMIGDKKE